MSLKNIRLLPERLLLPVRASPLASSSSGLDARSSFFGVPSSTRFASRDEGRVHACVESGSSGDTTNSRGMSGPREGNHETLFARPVRTRTYFSTTLYDGDIHSTVCVCGVCHAQHDARVSFRRVEVDESSDEFRRSKRYLGRRRAAFQSPTFTTRRYFRARIRGRERA